MSDPKKVKLTQIRLVQPGVFGNAAEVLIHLTHGMHIDAKATKLMFDEDPRFLKVAGANFTNLIPLTNVASLKVEPA